MRAQKYVYIWSQIQSVWFLSSSLSRRLREMSCSAPIEETLQYLQGPLREALNADDEEQNAMFLSLSLDLVMQSPLSLNASRAELFDALQAYYPAAMRGPTGSLEQLVK